MEVSILRGVLPRRKVRSEGVLPSTKFRSEVFYRGGKLDPRCFTNEESWIRGCSTEEKS
jgi:hypothetical protein